MFDDKIFLIEKRMFETVLGLNDMYFKQNKMVYKQLLSSLEYDLAEYAFKTGKIHHLEKKLLDLYEKMWHIK